MSDSPPRRPSKLIVVVAFDLDEQGELQPAFGPMEMQSEDRAIRTARSLAGKHAGVIAWSRDAEPDIGEYGPPKTLYVHGQVPDME